MHRHGGHSLWTGHDSSGYGKNRFDKGDISLQRHKPGEPAYDPSFNKPPNCLIAADNAHPLVAREHRHGSVNGAWQRRAIVASLAAGRPPSRLGDRYRYAESPSYDTPDSTTRELRCNAPLFWRLHSREVFRLTTALVALPEPCGQLSRAQKRPIAAGPKRAPLSRS